MPHILKIRSFIAMKFKKNNWGILNGLSNCSRENNEKVKSDFFMNSGICKRIIPVLKKGHKGPFVNGIVEKNGIEKVFLVCLEESSDFTFELAMLLEGRDIILERNSTNDLYLKRFSGLPANTREYLNSQVNHQQNEIDFKEEGNPIEKEYQESFLNDLSKNDLINIVQSLRLMMFIPTK